MPAIPRRDPNLAERKVYFHKAVNADDPDYVLDRVQVIEAIAALRGTANFYIDEGDEQYLCGIVDRAEPPQRIRFYRVRRRNLPETEEAGTFQDLELAARQGLAESIHVVLFENSVIGSEYNHYGPRVSTFGYYLNERCGQNVRIRQFIRVDVLQAILNMREIRRFRVKVTPLGATQLQERAQALSDGFEATDVFRAGKYMDLTLASEPRDANFTQQVKTLFRALRDSRGDPTEYLEAAQVYGVTADDLLDELDLLRDRVVIVQYIRRETPRHRTLDAAAAYAAIEESYAGLENELGEGGTLTVEP